MSTDADLILLGGHIRTPRDDRPHATAVAIVGGVLTTVGTDDEALSERGSRTEVIHLGGATVTPGLVDGHSHPVLGLEAVRGHDLSVCRDVQDLRAALVAAAATTAAGDWICGWGMDPNLFGTSPISRQVIDDVVGSHPTFLTFFDGHAALASQAALQRAGVTAARSFSARARIVCDDRGDPTGHLLEEAAIDLVASQVPAESFDQRKQRLRRLLDAMASTGLTGCHVMDLDGDALDLIAALDTEGELSSRLRFAPWCRPDDDDARIAELLALQGRAGRLWEVAGIKLFIDGTIDAGTAWLHQPDTLGESTSAYWEDPSDYRRALHRFAGAGVATATHAIGDAAVEHVLDTLDAAVVRDGGARHRIEHIETLPLTQVGRFAELGVIASMQPTHATDYTRADHTDNWSRRLGAHRADRGWPCRDLVGAGAVLVLGSDWPVAPHDPRLVLAAAQLRRPARHPELAPVGVDQKLTAGQGLHAMTTAPAWAAGAEHRLGKVAAGLLADLTVWASDPVEVPAADLADLPVTLTVVDGRVVHRSGS